MEVNEIKQYFSSIGKPIILDGAIGSLIQMRGYQMDEYLWSSNLNIESPKVIQDIHAEYISAGCDIITSNTFRTNPIAFDKSPLKYDYENLVKQSIDISKKVADKYNVLLAGSNAPAEDCYTSKRTVSKIQLEYNHHKHIELLYQSGADFILNETQSHMDEIEIICEYCSNKNIPFVISLLLTEELKILSGETAYEVIQFIKSFSPLLISVNCINNSVFSKFLNDIELNYSWGFYLNCCKGSYTNDELFCDIDENSYVDIVKSSLSFNPKLIGACCGSSPKHILKIKNLLYGTTNT